MVQILVIIFLAHTKVHLIILFLNLRSQPIFYIKVILIQKRAVLRWTHRWIVNSFALDRLNVFLEEVAPSPSVQGLLHNWGLCLMLLQLLVVWSSDWNHWHFPDCSVLARYFKLHAFITSHAIFERLIISRTFVKILKYILATLPKKRCCRVHFWIKCWSRRILNQFGLSCNRCNPILARRNIHSLS